MINLSTYVFKNASENDNKPETKRTGKSEISIYYDVMNGHEIRHGGQMARGEYDVNLDGTLKCGSFGVSKEIDAYRAQLAYDGSFSYMPKQDDSNTFISTLIRNDMFGGFLKKINVFSDINNAFIQSVSDINKDTYKTENIYPLSTDTYFYED